MDKLQKYRQIIQDFLADKAHPYTHSDDVDTQIIIDTESDHYQLCYVGWEEQKRIFGVLLHFDIKDEKVWIQYNGTELPVAQLLTEKGIPKSDIVIGFHSPFKRQFSGYAIA
ncbi:MAG: XisI protein [Leptolyngbyaceae cyanobacterium]